MDGPHAGLDGDRSQAFPAGYIRCRSPMRRARQCLRFELGMSRSRERPQTRVLVAKTRARSNIAAAADAVAKVGRCPPPAVVELLDRANFHEYNFFAIVRQRASREDDYESNTRWTWLRRRAGAWRLVRERARHRQDRTDQRSLRPIPRRRHPAR